MPNSTVPAADEGLPKLNPGAPDADQGSILVESDLGLAISRGRMVHSLSPTILAPERADRFYATFDRLMSLEQEGQHQHEQAWRVSRKTGRWPEGAHAVASDLRARANVVLVGGPGTGKTHLATAIGVQAIEQHRKRVRFFSTCSRAGQRRRRPSVATSTDSTTPSGAIRRSTSKVRFSSNGWSRKIENALHFPGASPTSRHKDRAPPGATQALELGRMSWMDQSGFRQSAVIIGRKRGEKSSKLSPGIESLR